MGGRVKGWADRGHGVPIRTARQDFSGYLKSQKLLYAMLKRVCEGVLCVSLFSPGPRKKVNIPYRVLPDLEGLDH